jgi:hypothetical protein
VGGDSQCLRLNEQLKCCSAHAVIEREGIWGKFGSSLYRDSRDSANKAISTT